MDLSSMLRTVKKVHRRSGKNSIYIFFDMIKCSVRYLAGYVDYDLLYFEELSDYQRSTFITRGVNDGYLRKMNDSSYYDNFIDKAKFNRVFGEFVKRDFISLKEAGFDEFAGFAEKHPVFMAKPIDEQCGVGVEKIDSAGWDLHELYDRLVNNNQLLIEELIVQCREMASLCPSSVNTLRIVTVRKNHKTTVMFRIIRIGNGKANVDNFHQGGMFSKVGENGVVVKPAIDNQSNVYTVHPVTGVRIEGFQVPMFDKVIDCAVRASAVIEQVGMVGWDVAITEDGPELVEGNQLPGYDLYQSKIHLNDDGTGYKPFFDSIIYGDDTAND